MTEQTAAVRGFQGSLHVTREKETRMILVRYESTDPKQAAAVVNALVDNYVEYNFRTKYDASRQATGWMEQRLDELKVKVEKSEQAMVDYERQNNIVSVGDKQTVAEARLEELNKSLSTAQTERLSKESIYKMVAENEAQVGFIQPGSLLNGLEAKEVELKEQYSAACGAVRAHLSQSARDSGSNEGSGRAHRTGKEARGARTSAANIRPPSSGRKPSPTPWRSRTLKSKKSISC